MPIEVLSSKVVFEAKLFKVHEVQVKYPNGQVGTYHDVLRQSAVTVFPLTKDNEIYYVHQYRYFFNEKIYEAVAGFIEEGEDPLESAKRELKEETGITAGRWTALPVMEMGASVVRITQPLFLAQDLEFGEQHFDEGEDLDVVKIPLEQALKMVESGEMRTAGTVFGTLYIDKMLREGKITA